MSSVSHLDHLESALREFFRAELGLSQEFKRDEELLSTGLITSIDVARIATFIEQQTELTIPDRDISPRFFDSIGRMLAYVEQRKR